MKVFIIDSNQKRNQSLTASLNEKAVMTYSTDSFNNMPDVMPVIDIIVLLDQDESGSKKLLENIKSDREQVVLTNLKNLDNANHKSVVFFNPDKDLELLLLNKIDAILEQELSTHFLPIAVDANSKVILDIARKAAKSHATLLITGETGAGKEVLAHYVHHHSLVSKGPFVTVNCAALPENMIEAILFGYEKGSFTSAINSYTGKFEQAQNGTLLLDEISEISIGLQAKLLRVLQEREVERLGGKKVINVNVRIIAATNRNLAEQVKAGSFRKDLYYRLNVIPIHCAALRERPLDIIPLAEFFIQHHARLLNRNVLALTDAARDKLTRYNWPGNIREMDNVIQRAVIMTDCDVLNDVDIELIDRFLEENNPHLLPENTRSGFSLEANEAKMIIDVLNEVDGCRSTAAKMLNISPRTLRYKLAKLRSNGLKVPSRILREDSYDH